MAWTEQQQAALPGQVVLPDCGWALGVADTRCCETQPSRKPPAVSLQRQRGRAGSMAQALDMADSQAARSKTVSRLALAQLCSQVTAAQLCTAAVAACLIKAMAAAEVPAAVGRHQAALLVLAGAAAGALLYAWATRARSDTRQTRQVQQTSAADAEPTAFSLQDDILREAFTRNTSFFGTEGQTKVLGSFVVVVGLGVRPEHQGSHPMELSQLT